MKVRGGTKMESAGLDCNSSAGFLRMKAVFHDQSHAYYLIRCNDVWTTDADAGSAMESGFGFC